MAKKTAGKGPKTYRVTIEGVCPMLQSQCKYLKPGKPPKLTPDEIANEWREKAYFSEDIGVYIPAEYIERTIAEAAGACVRGMKKASTASVFCSDTRFPIKMKGYPQFASLDDFVKYNLIDRRNVKLKKTNTIGRSRPMIPTGWRTTAEIMVISPEITADMLQQFLDHAGQYVGIGDYRPKFGRFDVVSFEEVR